MLIESELRLREVYGHLKGRAKDKQLDALERHSTNFIEHAPFMTLSTYATSGSLDCSPQGGSPGFVKVVNENCIIIPDSKGNNRLDSLVNIIETKQVGCLFLIPGVDETLRINGRGRISTSTAHLKQFSHHKNPPKACIEIRIKEVFLHCAKALMRSKLWSADAKLERSKFPTIATMLNDQLCLSEPPESQATMVARYQQDL